MNNRIIVLITEEEYLQLADTEELIKDSFRYEVVRKSDNMRRKGSRAINGILKRNDDKYFAFNTSRNHIVNGKYELEEVFPKTVTSIIYE
jgi:hypothetical protein